MSDGKIRILIFILCVAGSVLAGISTRDDSPYSRGGHELLTLIFGTPNGPIGAARSILTQPASATGKVPAASGGSASPGQRPERVDGLLSAETSGSRYRTRTPVELKVEQLIETAFRRYFRSYRIAGKSLTIRMPFGLNDEREDGPGYSQTFYLGGKGTTEQLWPYSD